VPSAETVLSELERIAAEGRAAWWFEPPLAAVAEHLARKLPEVAAGEALASVHGADLWLACACAGGDEAAIAAFDRLFAEDLARAHRRASTSRVALDDFLQILRIKLMGSATPKIHEYAGLGPLRAWVRTVATRTLLDLNRPAHAKERSADDGVFLAIPAPGDAPDLAYAKRLYGDALREAVQDAAAALSPEERNILREHYARGLSIDQLAKLHGYHRATAARRVQSARETLLAGVRSRLGERLGLANQELESALRLVQSEINITLERLLA